MGNEASQHMYNIGRCCATDEIEEVRRRDEAMEVDYGKQQTASDFKSEEMENKWGKFNTRDYAEQHIEAIVMFQAAVRGFLTRRYFKQQVNDVTLNSITQSFAISARTGNTMTERRPDPVKKMLLPDGGLYSGHVRRDPLRPDELVPDGVGKIKWPNGDKYRGRFTNGVPNGQGIKQIVATGITIQGNFTQYMAQDKEGKMTRENATGAVEYSYEGGLLYDRQDGWGVETTADGTRYEGYFTKGKRGPSGKWILRNGNVYEGEFLNGLMHGRGKLTNDVNKTSYDGQWRQGKMHGSGIYLWEDGRRYQGEYENDKKKGFGAYMWVDGRVYYGMWKDGVQHGEGTTVNPNKQMRKALWEAGKESMQLELSEAERQDILQYVALMQQEKERLIKAGMIRRAPVQSSRNRQLQNSARNSMNSAQFRNSRTSLRQSSTVSTGRAQ